MVNKFQNIPNFFSYTDILLFTKMFSKKFPHPFYSLKMTFENRTKDRVIHINISTVNAAEINN